MPTPWTQDVNWTYGVEVLFKKGVLKFTENHLPRTGMSASANIDWCQAFYRTYRLSRFYAFEKLVMNRLKVWGIHKRRSSYPELFCKKGVLKNLAKFTGKQLCRSLLYNKVAGFRPVISLKRDSDTGVFLWILQNF